MAKTHSMKTLRKDIWYATHCGSRVQGNWVLWNSQVWVTFPWVLIVAHSDKTKTSLLQMMSHQYCWKFMTWDVPGHKVPATDYLHPESPFPHHLSHPRVSQRMRGFRLGHLLILSELIHWWSCCNSSVWFMEVLHTTSRKAMCTLLWVREEPTTQSPLHLLNSACPRNPVASHQNSAGPGRLEEWNFHFHKMSIPVLFCSGLTSPQATFTFRRCKSLLCSGLISPQASSNVFLQTHLVSSICNLTS